MKGTQGLLIFPVIVLIYCILFMLKHNYLKIHQKGQKDFQLSPSALECFCTNHLHQHRAKHPAPYTLPVPHTLIFPFGFGGKYLCFLSELRRASVTTQVARHWPALTYSMRLQSPHLL